jgi:hypothetical protein
MNRTCHGVLALLLLLLPASLSANVLNVPGDFAQIHDAVQAAAPGDTVLVAAGTFNDCTHETEGPGSTPACVIMRPGVTLRDAGPEATIIDAQGLGRGIFVEDVTDVRIENLQVTGAFADIYGAGILVRQNATGIVLEDLLVQGNDDGGIVIIDGSQVELRQVTMTGNEAKQGGGLAVEENSTADLISCSIVANTAPSGGGVFIRSGCTVSMLACDISDNVINADFGNGGGVAVQNSQCDIAGSTISGNTTRGTGGGLAYLSGATGTIETTAIIGNATAASFNYGGGMSVQSSTPVIRDCLFVDNQAATNGSDGGAIDVQFGPAPTIENCTLVGNGCSSTGLAGGILVQFGVDFPVTNCLITDSTAGAAIACSFGAGPTVTGSNLWNNAGGDTFCGKDGGCNFSADPLYCNAAEGDYHVESGSPCAAGNHPDGGGCGASYVGAFAAGCVTAVGDTPGVITMLGNAPNPFNPQTVIFFALDEPGDVVIRIHDLAGRTLRTFERTGLAAGTRHEVRWNGRDEAGRALPSGVYLYRLQTRGDSTTKRMSLIR